MTLTSTPYPTGDALPIPRSEPLVAVDDLRVQFATDSGLVTSVAGVSFAIERGETLAMVGESGSGKSVTALALLGLLPRPAGRLAGGTIRFDGRDLAHQSEAAMRRLRGTEIGMVFQEPMTSLNPVLTVGEQIAERLRVHGGLDRREAAGRAVEMLDRVRIPEARQRARDYPHQMSGGMRQRAVIAMALACNPRLLIADEPTTALDVTIQAQILDLLRTLQSELGMAILFITHDLGVVAEMADRVIVMYAGRAVEQATVRELFADPRMPYTRALLRSIPRVDRAGGARQPLEAIRGNVPSPARPLPGCAFHPRCAHAEPLCADAVPGFEDSGTGHLVRCRRWRELAA
jgi:oligopeptide/dipeptide ABC transporter ATP-binding protein